MLYLKIRVTILFGGEGGETDLFKKEVVMSHASTVVLMESATSRAFSSLSEWGMETIKDYAVQKGLYMEDEIDAVECEYKKYIALCIGYPTMKLPTPRKLDDLWHQHILFTRDYHNMCKNVAGRFIHHQPFVGEMKASYADRMELARIFRKEFGRAPGNMWTNKAGCDNDNCGDTDGPNSCEGSCEPGGGDPGISA